MLRTATALAAVRASAPAVVAFFPSGEEGLLEAAARGAESISISVDIFSVDVFPVVIRQMNMSKGSRRFDAVLRNLRCPTRGLSSTGLLSTRSVESGFCAEKFIL